MNDKEIIEAILDDENFENILMTDDNQDTFEMAQLGYVPLHGMIYALLDLLKINGEEVGDEDAGLVILELDIDEQTGEHFVSTVEDDELFDEVVHAYENAPEDH
ncbi:MAG TPA: DUF1292 domain-containing protein [Candidatus Izemoplasmatales bacterium]|nr:DUF1292 domain-containing protein [Bacillota bacterium]HRY77151.1 DUF1292 domain-containing protein [Candidatus Izemoplasmatales bacterium]